ncbi:DUF6173 family protein [Sedimentitalea nanhaiensis]|uniref:Uncharacterized protein n=1 Tax=Sedimentitalea nanhaiensis TaxID=999627 RepID=A0A1I7CWK1_9RHOB|nr:DUF6173 family protein [Sedimentitalea nanhaiensis]SFU03817.1 hypothetical protein SAMN05216236_12068 [Sedimentitalea nanhaiensis]
MDEDVRTTAELVEADALPRMREAHADPDACVGLECVPEQLNRPVGNKSAAQWAYERLIIYIQNFEAQLDGEHEVAMGFVGGDAGVLRIEGLGYYDPDIVTFYGRDASGAQTQLIQHVSQLSVLLRAVSKPRQDAPANRIGFRLAAELEKG